jgi:hypothetical protein
VDLLSHYVLLVDCRNKRLLEGVTSLFTSGFKAPPPVPIVKVIAGSTTDKLLEEFPGLIRLTGNHREVQHTTHHIRTTPGPPVTCRSPRPDR